MRRAAGVPLERAFSGAGEPAMTSTFGILFELLFSGAALAFGVWQLIAVRRAQRADARRAARGQSQSS